MNEAVSCPACKSNLAVLLYPSPKKERKLDAGFVLLKLIEIYLSRVKHGLLDRHR